MATPTTLTIRTSGILSRKITEVYNPRNAKFIFSELTYFRKQDYRNDGFVFDHAPY
jgi:hypothetical protein